MFLVVGLGNPGAAYEKTRHNVGFMLIDKLIQHYRFATPGKKFHSFYSSGEEGGQKIALLKPQVFMNRSGIAVAECLNFFKIDVKNVIVVHDDLDLPIGKIRVKQGGGHGGHNGLKSVDQSIGVDYTRVRIGIGHPGDKEMVVGYVLEKFRDSEMRDIALVLDLMVELFDKVLQGDFQGFMNEFFLKGPVKVKNIIGENDES